MKDVLEKYLLHDEKILETFLPDIKRKFISKDGVLIPVGIILCVWAFLLFFKEYTVSSEVTTKLIWTIIFIVFSLYFTFGRFFVKSFRKKRTVYCITNKRFYRLTKGLFGGRKISFVDIKDTDKLELDGTPPDASTIIFETLPFSYTTFFANTGLAFEYRFFAFFDVKKANKLCKLISELKQQANIEQLIETRAQLEAAKRTREEEAARKEAQARALEELSKRGFNPDNTEKNNNNIKPENEN